jgi:putative transposase
MDLRERVIAAVNGGLSRNKAAARYGVAVSTAVKWAARLEKTGSVAPGKVGGHRLKTIRGEHADWLLARCKARAFTLRGLVVELQDVRGLKVDYRSVWEFVHGAGLSFKKKPIRNGTGSSRRRAAA